MNKLNFVRVDNKGVLDKEAITFAVVADIPNLEYYILCDTTYKGSLKSNELRHMFWFPKKAVKKGDTIIVITKVGTDTIIPIKNPATNIHMLHWNLGHTVWNKGGDQAFILKIESAKSHVV